MVKRILKVIVLCFATLFIICTLSCNLGSSSDASPDSSSEEVGDTGVPEEVAEAAEGIFGMIDEFMMVDDPSAESYPSGLSVDANSTEKYTMTLTGFSPEDGISLTGQLVLEQTSASPLTLVISGTLSATGEVTLTADLDVSATFAEGEGPPDDGPTSMSGTFTYNGTDYNITNVMLAIDLLDEEEEAEEEEEDYPSHFKPLPAGTYPPGAPLQFYCIGTREFANGSPWVAPDTLLQLDFTEDRKGYEMYEGSDRVAEGYLNWSTGDPDHPVLYLYNQEGGEFTGIVIYYYTSTEIYGHTTEDGWDFSYFNTDPTFAIDDIPEI